jgi:chorismate mutase
MSGHESAIAARIAGLRARIDEVDDAIVALLAARATLVGALWHAKAEAGVDVKDPEREEAVFARLRAAAATAGLDPEAVDEVFRGIVGAALSAELAAKVRG